MRERNTSKENDTMLAWALTFFIIALIAALFGFGGLAGTAASAGQMIFFAAIALLIVSLVTNGFRGRAL